MSNISYEVNFDGIVGPTHNYCGLSYGNIASLAHKNCPSNPKAAAKQGLQKMYHLHQMGIQQAVLPPHERPYFPVLRDLGFSGTDKEIQKKASEHDEELFLACTSAASMWVANAATVFPSADTSDHRVYFIPANLANKFHRSIETPMTAKILERIFANPKYFVHHTPLPSSAYFGDEGAANHSRFCSDYGKKGIQLFVYGQHAFKKTAVHPKMFPARQTYEASQAVARKVNLNFDTIVFAQQNPQAIDSGAFHNDVISVGNQNFYFYHEMAFVDTPSVIEEIRRKAEKYCGFEMIFKEVKNIEVSLKEAVDSYLFNSQIVTAKDGTVSLIAPVECRQIPSIHEFLEDLITSADNPLSQLHYFNLRESMQNGGGPACLRLRVVLTEEEMRSVNPHLFMNDDNYNRLNSWIDKHYRDHLTTKDLADPSFLVETQSALDELTQILQLGSLYSFQKS